MKPDRFIPVFTVVISLAVIALNVWASRLYRRQDEPYVQTTEQAKAFASWAHGAWAGDAAYSNLAWYRLTDVKDPCGRFVGIVAAEHDQASWSFFVPAEPHRTNEVVRSDDDSFRQPAWTFSRESPAWKCSPHAIGLYGLRRDGEASACWASSTWETTCEEVQTCQPGEVSWLCRPEEPYLWRTSSQVACWP